MFSQEFCKMFKSTYFTEQLRATKTIFANSINGIILQNHQNVLVKPQYNTNITEEYLKHRQACMIELFSKNSR